MKENGIADQRLRAASEEYATACDQLTQVTDRLRELTALSDSLQAQLKDVQPATTFAAVFSGADPDDARRRLGAVRHEIRNLQRVFKHTRHRVSTTRAAALREVGQAYRDEYVRSLRSLSLSMIDLARELERHREFERTLPGGSAATAGLPQPPAMVGDQVFAQPVSALTHAAFGAYLNLALRIGAITTKDVPAGWDHKPPRSQA